MVCTRSASPVVCAIAGYGLLLFTWLLAIPPFSSPDEWAHYLRVLGLSQGSLIGQKVREYDLPGATAEQLNWLRQAARSVGVPPGMSPLEYACQAFHPDQSAQCNNAVIPSPKRSQLVTHVGIYPPTFYLVPAALIRAASTPVAALRIGRGAEAATCLLLLVLALLCAFDPLRGGGSLLGVGLAATPMALFLGASLNTNGPEIFAGIAFATSLLRLARDDIACPRWVYLATAASGSSLAVARQLETAWAILYVLVFALIAGPSKLVRLWRVRRGALVAMGLTLAGACGANWLWEAAYGARVRVTITSSLITDMIRSGTLIADWMKEGIGVFQYLDTPMPPFAYELYALAFALLAVAALWHATGWERLMFAFLCLSAIAVPLGLYCATVRATLLGLQGRYVLPFMVVVPLFAGELFRCHGSTSHPLVRAGTLGSVALMSFLQFLGLYVNGRRSAVGMKGPILFLGRPEWSPPGGWGLCLGLAAVGCALVASALAAGYRTDRSQPTEGVNHRLAPGGSAP